MNVEVNPEGCLRARTLPGMQLTPTYSQSICVKRPTWRIQETGWSWWVLALKNTSLAIDFCPKKVQWALNECPFCSLKVILSSQDELPPEIAGTRRFEIRLEQKITLKEKYRLDEQSYPRIPATDYRSGKQSKESINIHIAQKGQKQWDLKPWSGHSFCGLIGVIQYGKAERNLMSSRECLGNS